METRIKKKELDIGDKCEFRSRDNEIYGASMIGDVIDIKRGLLGIKYLVAYSYIDAGWFDAKINKKEWVKGKDIIQIRE